MVINICKYSLNSKNASAFFSKTIFSLVSVSSYSLYKEPVTIKTLLKLMENLVRV